MKNFLAIDTSSNYLTVAAVKDGEEFSVFLPDCTMKHSVSFMGAVDEVLKKAGLTLPECDFFAAVVGAGSFTGIRIGISAVKGFCLACGKPALPVTSFETIAYNAVGGKKLCLVDALHDSYYACGYEGERVSLAPCYLAEEEVLALSAKGYALCAASPLPIGEKTKVQIVDPVKGLFGAVRSLSEKGAFGELNALYVRKSSAELNREKGE
ncbi:MAG: tRNA (adenosine(37)-N6)-threonylcarbamoyltransferase complex dimerization subunit type 1 TsaB [Clostridia bacterium]|nr:tRNA (adenosine(37)-N6)-threonylcarbamoyltransferase complex dimerization subunit type 1 TsaB [Clostridia bacterium]